MRTVAEIQPDQVAEQMGVGLRELGAVVGVEQGRDTGLGLALGVFHAVAIGDAQLPDENVAQQAIGLAQGLRGGAAAQDANVRRACAQPALELEQQPALAQAGLGDHRDHRQPPVGDHARERVLATWRVRCRARPCGVAHP